MQSLITLPTKWQRLFAANQTGATVPAPAPTITQPSGDGVIPLNGMSNPPNVLALAFFGAGADDNTGLARVTGWKRCDLAGSVTLWVPTPLALLDLTLSTMTGVAGAAILNTDRFVDIIAEVGGYTTAEEILQAATAENTLAVYKVDVFGHELVQVQVGTNSSATNMNGIWSGF
jgi:hypothetical protein